MFGTGPAILHAALRDRDLRFSNDRGLLFGLTIFVLWDETLSVLTGIANPPKAHPWQAHLRGLVGHLSLGVATHVALTALKTNFDIRPLKQGAPGRLMNRRPDPIAIRASRKGPAGPLRRGLEVPPIQHSRPSGVGPHP